VTREPRHDHCGRRRQYQQRFRNGPAPNRIDAKLTPHISVKPENRRVRGDQDVEGTASQVEERHRLQKNVDNEIRFLAEVALEPVDRLAPA
jgi:hypothetical protein